MMTHHIFICGYCDRHIVLLAIAFTKPTALRFESANIDLAVTPRLWGSPIVLTSPNAAGMCPTWFQILTALLGSQSIISLFGNCLPTARSVLRN